MAAGESLFMVHKGNILRRFLPPAVLRNKKQSWRGEEPHTQGLQRKGHSCSLKTQLKCFATPKWTLAFYQWHLHFWAEILHYFSLCQRLQCVFPLDRLWQWCLAAFGLPRSLFSCLCIAPSSEIPLTTWGSPGQWLCWISSLTLCLPWADPSLSLGDFPACPSCMKSVLETRQRGEDTVQFNIATHPAWGGDTPLPGSVALSTPVMYLGWDSTLCWGTESHPWVRAIHEPCCSLLSPWENPNLPRVDKCLPWLADEHTDLQVKFGGWSWREKISCGLKWRGCVFVQGRTKGFCEEGEAEVGGMCRDEKILEEK